MEEMQFIVLSFGNVHHILKDSTLYEKENGRKSGYTFCGQETNNSIDEWLDHSVENRVCGICYRAKLKKSGVVFSRASATYRSITLDISKIPLGHVLGKGRKNKRF